MNDPTKYEPKVETGFGSRLLDFVRELPQPGWPWNTQPVQVILNPQEFNVTYRDPSANAVVRFHRLPHGKGLPLPAYATAGAAGMDLAAADDATLGPGQGARVPTGFRIEIPPGFEGQIRPRSGLALKHGVTVLNSPGTIDSDYRGEVGVILVNHGSSHFRLRRGDRIAQLVIAPVSRLKIEEAEQLSETERGAGGFGSTGS